MARRCPDCHESWGAAATFCGSCGAALGTATEVRDGSPRGWVGAAHVVRAAGTVGLVAAIALAWWLAGGDQDDVAPSIEVDRTADAIDLPTRAATATADGDAGMPLEILATCHGDDGDTGCVRWARRSGMLPRVGEGPLATVLDADRLEIVDMDTGARRWTAAVSAPPTPPLAVGDHTVLVEDGIGVRALDASDGDERWRHPGWNLPMLAPDQVELPLVVLDDFDGTLHAVDVRDGTVRWTRTGSEAAGVPPFVVPVGADRMVIGLLDRAAMVDVASGRTLWSVGGDPEPEPVVGVSVGHVVTMRAVGGEDLQVRVRDRRGRVTATIPVGPDVRVRQVGVTEALVLLRTPSALVAHRLDDGTRAWRRDDLPGTLVTARPLPLSVGGVVIAGRTGLASVAIRSLAVVVMGNDGTATVLDARTGEDLRVLGEASTTGLRVGDGFLTPGRLWRTDAQSLEVHDLTTGRRLLRVEVRAPPSVVRTRPLVIETSGRLVRLDLPPPTASAPNGQ